MCSSRQMLSQTYPVLSFHTNSGVWWSRSWITTVAFILLHDRGCKLSCGHDIGSERQTQRAFALIMLDSAPSVYKTLGVLFEKAGPCAGDWRLSDAVWCDEVILQSSGSQKTLIMYWCALWRSRFWAKKLHFWPLLVFAPKRWTLSPPPPPPAQRLGQWKRGVVVCELCGISGCLKETYQFKSVFLLFKAPSAFLSIDTALCLQHRSTASSLCQTSGPSKKSSENKAIFCCQWTSACLLISKNEV